MKDKINEIMLREMEALSNLLSLLENQHKLILDNDVFGLEAIVAKIQQANKAIAEIEMERRALTKGEAMSKIIEALGEEEAQNNYRKIKLLLSDLQLQKDTNDMLLKQGIAFTAKILNVINPHKEAKTYNSYGKFKK